MAKEKITQKLAEEIQKNNIELAKELSKRKQKITELNTDLRETRFCLLETERRLAATNSKNYAIQRELETLQQHNQKLQIDLNDRDNNLEEYKRLFISTFASATEKYSNIMRVVGAMPTAVMVNKTCSTDAALSEDETDEDDDDEGERLLSNSTGAIGVQSRKITKVVTNTMPSERDDDSEFVDDDADDDDGESEISNVTLQNEPAGDASDTTECTDDDEFDVNIAASPSSIPMNADTTFVKSVQEEFLDDAIAELSSTVDQLYETLKNATLEQNDDGPKDQAICQEQPATIPSITVTECNDANDAKTPAKVSKRTKSNGFLQVPKLSFGNRKSEPRTSLNSKSSPTFDKHRSLTPKSKRRLTILHKIREISPLAKSPENSITSAIRDKTIHQTFHHSSGSSNTKDQSNEFEISGGTKSPKKATSPLNSPVQTKTPISNRHSTKQSTDEKTGLSNTSMKLCFGKPDLNLLPKRLFKDVNNNSNQTKNAELPSSPKSPALPIDVASIKTSPKKLKATVVNPNDCIARHRTTRRAAPTDLTDPFTLLKKRRKFL